jgi:Ser-tRNA(Ala) deacylase AlaX
MRTFCSVTPIVYKRNLTDRQERWRVARRETAYSKRLKLAGSLGHVTVDAQNRPKLGRLHTSEHLLWRVVKGPLLLTIFKAKP